MAIKFITIQNNIINLYAIEYVSEIKEYKSAKHIFWGFDVCMKSGRHITVKDEAHVIVEKTKKELLEKIKEGNTP